MIWPITVKMPTIAARRSRNAVRAAATKPARVKTLCARLAGTAIHRSPIIAANRNAPGDATANTLRIRLSIRLGIINVTTIRRPNRISAGMTELSNSMKIARTRAAATKKPANVTKKTRIVRRKRSNVLPAMTIARLCAVRRNGHALRAAAIHIAAAARVILITMVHVRNRTRIPRTDAPKPDLFARARMGSSPIVA